MKPRPSNQLDPRVKNVWRINDAIWIVFIFACLAVTPGIFMASDSMAELGRLLMMIIGICFVVALVVWLVVLPPIRYERWRYEVSEDYLDIAKGIVWRKRYTIPFIRVQNTDTRQGPACIWPGQRHGGHRCARTRDSGAAIRNSRAAARSGCRASTPCS